MHRADDVAVRAGRTRRNTQDARMTRRLGVMQGDTPTGLAVEHQTWYANLHSRNEGHKVEL